MADLGVRSAQVRSTSQGLWIVLGPNESRVPNEIVASGELRLYDWEPNLIGRATRRKPHPVPARATLVRTERSSGDLPARSWFVLRHRPALDKADIANARQDIDRRTSQPIVTIDFTGPGRQRFEDVTRRIVQRGIASGKEQHFAIVLDDKIVSLPSIDYKRNPVGISARNGAQISGGFTVDEARALAAILRSEALPLRATFSSEVSLPPGRILVPRSR